MVSGAVSGFRDDGKWWFVVLFENERKADFSQPVGLGDGDFGSVV